MFCGKCGENNHDGAKFCSKCGADLEVQKAENTVPESQNAVASNIQNNETQSSSKNKKIGIIAACSVAVVLIIALISFISLLFGGRSPKETANKALATFYKGDAKGFASLIPDATVKYMIKERYDNKKEFIEGMDDLLERQLGLIELYVGDDWKAEYEVKSVKDVSEKELKSIKKAYKDRDINIKISDAKNVKVRIDIEGENLDDSETMEITVIKVGRSWYLDIQSLGSLGVYY